MSRSIAYLLGAYIDPQTAAAVEAGDHPRAEFDAFVERTGVPLLTYREVECGRSQLARNLLRRGYPHWGLPALALSERARYSGLLTSGDDVWLPLLVQAAVRRAAIPTYNITHGSFFGSRKFALLARWFRRMPRAHFLCLSESLRRALVERFRIPGNRVHNTSYGVDTRFFAPCGEPGEPPLIVSAGTASRDYRALLSAAESIPARVRIAADSAWFPASLDIEREPLPTGFEVGPCDGYTGLRDLYRQALFVVVPLYDSPRAAGYAVIAEAMAMGKPVITTRIRAHSDFVVDGETGFYVEPGDSAGLRAKMDTLLNDRVLARDMGERARARMESLYNLDAYSERMERIVGSLDR